MSSKRPKRRRKRRKQNTQTPKGSAKGNIKDLAKSRSKKALLNPSKTKSVKFNLKHSNNRKKSKNKKSKISASELAEKKRAAEVERIKLEEEEFHKKAEIRKKNAIMHRTIEDYFFEKMISKEVRDRMPDLGTLDDFFIKDTSTRFDLITSTTTPFTDIDVEEKVEDNDETTDEHQQRYRQLKQQRTHELTPFLEVLLEHETDKSKLQSYV